MRLPVSAEAAGEAAFGDCLSLVHNHEKKVTGGGATCTNQGGGCLLLD